MTTLSSSQEMRMDQPSLAASAINEVKSEQESKGEMAMGVGDVELRKDTGNAVSEKGRWLELSKRVVWGGASAVEPLKISSNIMGLPTEF